MSDGSLTQDEIDALLMGDTPAASPASPVSYDNGFEASEKQAVLELLTEVIQSQSTTLSGIMVKDITIGQVNLNLVSKEQCLAMLPDEVVEIQVAYNSGLVGSHLYLLSGPNALKIAVPMMGQTNLELNDTSISAVCEAINQISGALTTQISDKIGATVITDPPQGAHVPKVEAKLPEGPFIQVSYSLEIEGQGNVQFYEIFDLSLMKILASKLGVTSVAAASDKKDPMASMFGDIASSSSGNSAVQQMDSSLGVSMDLGLGKQPPPNVQGIQLSELSPTISVSEQRNIGLLMDVSMDLTVELGRTRWKIKEILGMGEGTIIELEKLAGEPVDILVNNNLIARGEVVVIEENFGVRVTEIVSTVDRMDDR